MDRPKTIFKYEPFALRAIQNLKASSVHFGSTFVVQRPLRLCIDCLDLRDTTHDELEQLRS